MVWCSMLPKTQLICFRQRYTNTFPPEIMFNGSTLRFVEEVSHLGHILAYYTLLGGCYVYSSTINQLPTQEGVKVRISTVVRANIKGMV